jgi:hypothetical protein
MGIRSSLLWSPNKGGAGNRQTAPIGWVGYLLLGWRGWDLLKLGKVPVGSNVGFEQRMKETSFKKRRKRVG